jgi:nucleoside-diphosphate-sugar epimerase
MRVESSALIGHTGFVGSNLLRQHTFDDCFNSVTIDQIVGRSFDLVVCAGARGAKWKANANPEQDLDHIDRLVRTLEQIEARKLVLISTVDVFVNPADVDEDSRTPMTGLQPYGRNRRRLEQIVASRFDTSIIRLPGLYGPGLKKNVIYDFLHDNEVSKIDSRGVFQFYGIERLWRDIETAIDNELELVHLPTEPVSVADVARAAFGIEFTNEVAATPSRYDVRTKYASVFGGVNGEPYLEHKAAELAGISAFVEAERGEGGRSRPL